MKKTFKAETGQKLVLIRRIAGLAVLMAAIIFGFNACGKEDATGTEDEIPAGGGGGSAITGNTIASGMTVRYDPDITNMEEARAQTDFSYGLNWDDNNGKNTAVPLSYYFNGSPSVKINGGKLTITLGTPKNEFMGNIVEDVGDLTVAPGNAKWFFYDDFNTQNSKYYVYLDSEELLVYVEGLVYVDMDVTITGTETWEQYTTRYNVSLKKGWNWIICTENTRYQDTYTASTTFPSGHYWVVNENWEVKENEKTKNDLQGTWVSSSEYYSTPSGTITFTGNNFTWVLPENGGTISGTFTIEGGGREITFNFSNGSSQSFSLQYNNSSYGGYLYLYNNNTSGYSFTKQ